MKTYNPLWDDFCDYKNLLLAFLKARKRKTLKSYVIEFKKLFSNEISSIEINRIIKDLQLFNPGLDVS